MHRVRLQILNEMAKSIEAVKYRPEEELKRVFCLNFSFFPHFFLNQHHRRQQQALLIRQKQQWLQQSNFYFTSYSNFKFSFSILLAILISIQIKFFQAYSPSYNALCLTQKLLEMFNHSAQSSRKILLQQNTHTYYRDC